MKAGFCEQDITPLLGMECPGDYQKSFVRAFHDPLKVRAVVLDDGDDRVALVGVDTAGMQSQVAVDEVRQRIERGCGILGDHVLVAASHTHSGGPFSGFLADTVAEAPPLIRKLALDHSVAADPGYCEWVKGRIVTAVCEADRTKQEALLSVGSGREDQVSFNRRVRMKGGRVYTHPGKGNPDALEYGGPIDPEVGVIGAWTLEGKLLGCVVNFACHGTTWGGSVSADWVCYLERVIKRVWSERAAVVFLNGACGDVTQVDNLSPFAERDGEENPRFVGTRVGAEALKVLVSVPRGELTPVAAVTSRVLCRRRRPGPERLAEATRIVEEGLRVGNTGTTEWLFAKEALVADYLVGREPEVEVELQAVQVGPAVFAANPAELFCQLGLEIKRRSQFPFTYVVELANGDVGYVPSEDAFLPSGGGYETVLTSYSNLEVSAGPKIVAAFRELLGRLEPGAVPQRPPAPPFSGPWSYGTLGPDV